MILIGLLLGEGELVKFMPTVLQQSITQLLPPHQLSIQPLLIIWRKKQGGIFAFKKCK